MAATALLMFKLTHRALGRNWSVRLDVREDHQLITEGIYRKIRHPMYSAFWLWAFAQALLLPNWVAGFSGLVGFGILFFVKANTVLFMSLTLSGFSEPLTGDFRKRFQSGRSAANLERPWHGPWPLTESHLLQPRPAPARRRIRRDGKPYAATAVARMIDACCEVLEIRRESFASGLGVSGRPAKRMGEPR